MEVQAKGLITPNDVMCGNWVMDTRYDENFTKEINEYIQVTPRNLKYCGRWSPIPIDHDILIKNEFNFIENEWGTWNTYEKNINGFFFHIYTLSNGKDNHYVCHIDNQFHDNIMNISINYIHELQHIIKLCKINNDIVL